MKDFIKKHKALMAASALFILIASILILLLFVFRNGFWFTLFTLLPISELRGSVPLALLSYDWPVWAVYPAAVILNALVAPLVFIFLDNLHPLFYKWSFYRRLFDRFITKARNKMHEKVSRYGMAGIMIFVGIPLPITGAYTGTAGAWILGLNRKKTMLAVLCGVMLSCAIVTGIVMILTHVEIPEGLRNFLEIFIKDKSHGAHQTLESRCL